METLQFNFQIKGRVFLPLISLVAVSHHVLVTMSLPPAKCVAVMAEPMLVPVMLAVQILRCVWSVFACNYVMNAYVHTTPMCTIFMPLQVVENGACTMTYAELYNRI